MKIVCIIQARMGSSRLPGKVLLDLAGKPMLQRVIDRVAKSKLVDQIVVATTADPKDDRLVEAIKNYPRATIYRGSEEDVLDRYYQAAKQAGADMVIRVTSDCPLLDPEVVDKVVKILLDDHSVDYASNVLGDRTFPRGLDVEAFTFKVLEMVWNEAKEKPDREHVTLFIRNNPEMFEARNLKNDRDLSQHRWTVDEQRDYELANEIYGQLRDTPDFTTNDILEIIKNNPKLMTLNNDVQQKPFDGRVIVACIQARMGSTRLPKKVLMDLNGAPVVVQIARRLSACKNVDKVVVATPETEENKVIVECANQNNLPVYAGSENDIVDRMYQTAKKFGATALIRITADCPLVDPKLVDMVAGEFLKDKTLDFVTNVLPPTYPDGLDIELISLPALTKLWERTRGDAMRSEWFNHDVRNNPDVYKVKNLSLDRDLSKMRWTVDYPEDMQFVQEVYRQLSPSGEIFYMDDVLRLLERKPDLGALNEKYVRDAAYYAAVEAQKNQAEKNV